MVRTKLPYINILIEKFLRKIGDQVPMPTLVIAEVSCVRETGDKESEKGWTYRGSRWALAHPKLGLSRTPPRSHASILFQLVGMIF